LTDPRPRGRPMREEIEAVLRRLEEANQIRLEITNLTANPTMLTASGGWSRPRDLAFPAVPPSTEEERDAPLMLRSRDRDALALWADDLRYPLASRPRRRSRRVNAARDTVLSRRRTVATIAGDIERNPVVLLELSRHPRRGIHRLITDLAESRQIGVVILPAAVLSTSGVESNSIQVVARSERPSSPFAAPDVLISGRVPIPPDERQRVWEEAYNAMPTKRVASQPGPYPFDDEDELSYEEVATGIPKIDGVSYHSWRDMPTQRTAYFLSGFDANEFWPKWYFCELPPTFTVYENWSAADIMASAFDSLKPESVRIAEEMGYRVKRQGDMYAIPMKTAPQGLAAVAPRAFIFRSNHRADHVAYINDEVYARGNIIHRPLDRKADHGPLRLGYRWHRMVKNTVPVAK